MAQVQPDGLHSNPTHDEACASDRHSQTYCDNHGESHDAHYCDGVVLQRYMMVTEADAPTRTELIELLECYRDSLESQGLLVGYHAVSEENSANEDTSHELLSTPHETTQTQATQPQATQLETQDTKTDTTANTVTDAVANTQADTVETFVVSVDVYSSDVGETDWNANVVEAEVKALNRALSAISVYEVLMFSRPVTVERALEPTNALPNTTQTNKPQCETAPYATGQINQPNPQLNLDPNREQWPSNEDTVPAVEHVDCQKDQDNSGKVTAISDL